MSYPRLNEEQLDEFREGFGTFDKNKDGKINAAELAALMRWLGTIPASQDLHDVMRDFGQGDSLTLDGFLQYMSRKFVDDFLPNEIIEAFQVFDKDGKGMISASELRHVLSFMGDRLDDNQVEEMLGQAVGAGDGSLLYEPFVRKMLERR